MADEIVGAARIVITPDMSGFDAALLADVQSAADTAGEAVVAAFREAAESAAQALAGVGGEGFGDITTAADQTVADLQTTFGGASDAITDGLTLAADAGSAALEGIGSGAANQLVLDFSGASDALTATLEAGASEADAALAGIGAGAGDEIAAEFAGAGEQIVGEFTGVGGALAAEVATGTSEAAANLQELEAAGTSTADSLGSAFEGLGGVIAAVAGAVAIGVFFKAAERIQSISGITNQLIETTGAVANVTADEMVALGDSIEAVTGTESELVQEAGNVLLTFKNVRNEVGEGNDIFNRAIVAGEDLAAVLGGDVSGSALQLGKALQDPIKGLSVLGRAGVTFTEEQKELVRALVAEGDLLSAQKVILEELEGQVGGAAAASANASDLIRNAIGRVTDEIGAGLLPAADDLAARLPAIIDELVPIGTELGEALGAGALVAVDALLALTPVLGITTDLLVLLLPVLETAVDIIDAIPDPVLQVAASVLLVNKALAATKLAIAASGLLGIGTTLARVAVPAGAVSGAFTGAAAASVGLRAGLATLVAGLNPVTVGVAAAAGSVLLYNKVIGDAEDQGKAFAQTVRDGFDPATASLDELVQASSDLDTKIGDLQSSVDDSFWGRNTVNRDFNAAINEGVEGLQELQVEIDAAIVEQRRLEAEAEFGAVADQLVGIAGAMSIVRDESTEAATAISGLRNSGDLTDDAFVVFAITLGDAALSEEAMAAAAQALGTDVESLTGFITGVNEALGGFIDTAVSGLPEIANAFRDANEDAKVSAREFIDGLNEDALEIATFFGNIQAITEAGFAEVAGTLAEQGVEIAGVAAEELAAAARKGNLELLLRTQEGLNARDTAIANSTDYLTSVLGPAYVSATGVVGREATEAFGAEFDLEEQVRIGGALAISGLDEQGQRIAAIAATQGSRAAREFGAGLNMSDAAIAAAVAAGEAIRANAPTEAARTAGGEVTRAFSLGLVAGVQFNLADMVQAGIDLYNAIETGVRQAGVLFSPSRKMMEIGRDVSAGFAIGVGADSAGLSAAGAGLFTDVERGLVDSLTGGFDEASQEVIRAAEQIIRGAAANIESDPITIGITPVGTATTTTPGGTTTVLDTRTVGNTLFGSTSGAGGVTIDARDWHVEAPDPLAAAQAVINRLRAEVFLQRRS